MKTGRISDLLHHTINHITSSCFHRNRYQTSCRGVFLGSCYLRQWCASWRTMVSGYSSLAWAWGGSVKVFCKLIPFLHGQVQRSLVKLSWESLIHQKLSGAVRWGEIFPPTSLSPCLLPHLPLHLYFHLLLHLPSHLPLDILSTSLSPSFPSSPSSPHIHTQADDDSEDCSPHCRLHPQTTQQHKGHLPGAEMMSQWCNIKPLA